MALKRRLGFRMYFALLIVGNIATALALSGVSNTVVQNLDCTNDLDGTMFCFFEAQNCSEYSLTLRYEQEVNCTLKQCDNGQCCCSINMMIIYGEKHNATVLKGGESIGSKIISVIKGMKPRVPTNISVKESNGNFQVKWKTNMSLSFDYNLSARVTYREKGRDPKEVFHNVTPTEVDGFKYYEIDGGKLKPSTTYVLSVESYTNLSGRYSDSSEEVEFTTPVSPDTVIVAVILSLSFAAFIITGAIYGCYVKLKVKWWDSVAKCPNPKLLHMRPSEQEILKPEVFPVISKVYIEPLVPDDSKSWGKETLIDSSSGSIQQSSGISTCSSAFSYANTEPVDIKACIQEALGKALPNISPTSPLTTNPLMESSKDSGLFSTPYNSCGVRAEDMSMGSFGLDNKTYSLPIPNLQHQVTTDSSDGQTQAEMRCDPAYRPMEGDTVIGAEQQVPACLLVNLPPMVSSPMPTDMSYQQCSVDPERFSYADDSSLSSVSSGTDTIASCDAVSRDEMRCESSNVVVGGATELNGKIEEVTMCDENPCYGCVPSGSCRFPPVDDSYQAFQSLVEQPDIMFSEKRSGDEEEHLSKCPEESFTKMPQSFFSPDIPGFINNVQGGQCLSEVQRPFDSLISADLSMPIITDSGYQSV